MKPEELNQIIRDWQRTGDPAKAQVILAELEPNILAAVASYGLGRDPVALAKAKLVTLDGLERFNPAKSSVNTFLYSELRRMGRIAAQTKAPLPVPERQWHDYRLIEDAEKNFEADNGRLPTMDELSEVTGLSDRRIRTIRTRVRPVTYSDNIQASGEDAGVAIGAETPDFSDLATASFYDSLSDRNDRQLLEWTTGLGGGKTLPKTEIAKRWHVSPAAVSQRAARLSERLSAYMADYNKVFK